MMFEKGVKYYTKGQAVITVNFPEGEISCNYCPFCRAEEALKRY